MNSKKVQPVFNLELSSSESSQEATNKAQVSEVKTHLRNYFDTQNYSTSAQMKKSPPLFL